MSTTTTNLGMIKPDDTDTADIGDVNDNMDAIDTAIGDLRDSVLRYKGIAFGDLNDYTLMGVYYIDNRVTANKPVSEDLWGYLVVITSTNYTNYMVTQTFLRSNSVIYHRTKSGPSLTWGAWRNF